MIRAGADRATDDGQRVRCAPPARPAAAAGLAATARACGTRGGRRRVPAHGLLRVDSRALRGVRRPATTATTTWPTGPSARRSTTSSSTTPRRARTPPSSWCRTPPTSAGTTRCAPPTATSPSTCRPRTSPGTRATGTSTPSRSAWSTRASSSSAAPGTPRRCTGRPPGWCATWPTRYDIPLDRAHILGHDNVPGTTAGHRRRHARRPGPLLGLGALLRTARQAAARRRRPRTRAVTIRPDYATNQPLYTGCVTARRRLPAARLVLGAAAHRAARGRPAGQGHRQAPDRRTRTTASTTTAPAPPPASVRGRRARRATGRRSGTSARRPGSTTRPAPHGRARRRPGGDAEGRVSRDPGVRQGVSGGRGLPGGRAGAGDHAVAVHALGRAAVQPRPGRPG